MNAPNASSVSAALRRAGFLPIAPSDRSREGLRCTNTSSGRVRVEADLNSATEADRMSEDAADALAVLYDLDRSCGQVFYVTGHRA